MKPIDHATTQERREQMMRQKRTTQPSKERKKQRQRPPMQNPLYCRGRDHAHAAHDVLTAGVDGVE